MRKKSTYLLLLFLCLTSVSFSQVTIGSLDDPHESAVLDIVSTDKGVLFPRMTSSQRKAIINPAHGLCVYDTNESRLFTYNINSGEWDKIPTQDDIDSNPGKSVRAKNIILMIASGLGTTQLQAGFTNNSNYLSMTTFPYTGFAKTGSANSKTTDSAAAATAISTGVKTNNGYLGIDPYGSPLTSIMKVAQQKGLSTGIVVTSSLTNTTPAAFYSHQYNSTLNTAIASDLVSSGINVCIGGGSRYFSQDVRNAFLGRGYNLVYSLGEITPAMDKVVALLADEHLPKMSESRGNVLSEATEKALEILKKNNSGFFLMVEGSHIDFAGTQMDFSYMMNELNDFDNAVAKAKEFAKIDEETLVVVTGNHETGGLMIYGSTSMLYFYNTSQVNGKKTSPPVPIFSFGPGAEYFTGFLDNTDFKPRMEKLLGF